MWSAVETHLRGFDLVKEAKQHRSAYHSTISAARASPDSENGTHGGAWLAVSRNLNSTRVNGDKGAKVYDASQVQDLCGRTIHLHSCDVTAFAAYARTANSTRKSQKSPASRKIARTNFS